MKLQWLVPDAAGTDVSGAPAAVYLLYFALGKFQRTSWLLAGRLRSPAFLAATHLSAQYVAYLSTTDCWFPAVVIGSAVPVKRMVGISTFQEWEPSVFNFATAAGLALARGDAARTLRSPPVPELPESAEAQMNCSSAIRAA